MEGHQEIEQVNEYDPQWIYDLRMGKTEILDEIYREHRKPFLAWIKKHFSINDEDATDLYQDTIISFYKAVRAGNLKQLNVNLKTYLYGIGKNLAFKRYRKTLTFRKHEENIKSELPEVEDPFVSVSDERIDLVIKAFESLDEPCYSILKLFYYQRLTMDEIAEVLNYKNRDTVKSQKSRCMKKIKEIVKKFIHD